MFSGCDGEMPIGQLLAMRALGSAVDRRAYFFLLRQEKVAKKKATPGCAVGCADFPARLDGPGGWLNSPAARTTPADCPRPICVARRSTRGPKKRRGTTANAEFAVGMPIPLGGAEQRRGWRKKGEHCLSPLGGELRSPRQPRVAQGTPRSGAPTRSRLFFANFLLAKQKKVRSPVNGEKQPQTQH